MADFVILAMVYASLDLHSEFMVLTVNDRVLDLILELYLEQFISPFIEGLVYLLTIHHEESCWVKSHQQNGLVAEEELIAAFLTLSCSPTFDLRGLRFLFRDEGLNYVNPTSFIDSFFS